MTQTYSYLRISAAYRAHHTILYCCDISRSIQVSVQEVEDDAAVRLTQALCEGGWDVRGTLYVSGG
jgi:hypothetical protein